MFPFVSSFLINPLHNCHLSFSKSDFGEIWLKAGEAKKTEFKVHCFIEIQFCRLFTNDFLAWHSVFSKDQLSQFHNQGQFLCCCILPILKFFLAKAGERWVWAAANQRQFWFCKIAPSVCQPFPMCEFPWLFVKCRTDEILSSLIENANVGGD